MHSATSASLLGYSVPLLAKVKRYRFTTARDRTSLLSLAVAAPTTEPDVSDSERQRLALETGYRSIGKDLPNGVTLGQIVHTLPQDVFQINDWKAWRSVAISVGAVTLSLALVAVSPWYLLPFSYAFSGQCVALSNVHFLKE